MTGCDDCNRNICHGCPYQENKTLAERFADNLEISSDHAIEMLEYADIDCVIRELIEIYWRKDKAYAIKEIQRRLS